MGCEQKSVSLDFDTSVGHRLKVDHVLDFIGPTIYDIFVPIEFIQPTVSIENQGFDFLFHSGFTF